MQFRTEINNFEISPKVSYHDKIFCIGSCFSVEMSEKLNLLKYSVCQNPTGITFNPVSIADTIKMMKKGISLPEEAPILNESVWCHPAFHSRFNHIEKDVYISNTTKSIKSAKNFLKDCSWSIMTLGTAYVHELKETKRIANNCHKLPSQLFRKKFLEVAEIVESLNTAINDLEALSQKDLNIVLTVSPVRHSREGLHNNQLSKARCLLAVHEICQKRKNVHYFPSYEIMLDDLRDYRFYKEDMVHPSIQATDYIFQKFEESILDKSEQAIRLKIQKISRDLQHKAFNPQSDAHQKFLSNIESDIQEFQKKYGKLGIKFD